MSEYITQLRELANSANCDLELPADWDDNSNPSGNAYSLTDDERLCQRIPAKSSGLMWFEESHLPRSSHPVHIRTRDFSRAGVSFLAPLGIMPEEKVRIVLPTMWLQLSVVRAKEINNKCFEIGAKVISLHNPSFEAFEIADPIVRAEEDAESSKQVAMQASQ